MNSVSMKSFNKFNWNWIHMNSVSIKSFNKFNFYLRWKVKILNLKPSIQIKSILINYWKNLYLFYRWNSKDQDFNPSGKSLKDQLLELKRLRKLFNPEDSDFHIHPDIDIFPERKKSTYGETSLFDRDIEKFMCDRKPEFYLDKSELSKVPSRFLDPNYLLEKATMQEWSDILLYTLIYINNDHKTYHVVYKYENVDFIFAMTLEGFKLVINICF